MRPPAPRVGDEERREARQLAARKPRHHEHALGEILPFVDRCSEGVELVQLASVLVRDQEPHRFVAVGKPRGDARAELVQPLPGRADTCSASGKRFDSRRRVSG